MRLHQYTETTINNTRDFRIGKRLTNLPALREIGFSANRRLLGVQQLSHNPIHAAEAFAAMHDPIITDTGHRIAGIRLGDPRAHALLPALLVFRLLPHGFLNRDLRGLLAGLLGKTPDELSTGQITYDLRRLRAHGLITRIPGTHRYQITDQGATTPCCSPTSTPAYCSPAWPNSPTPTHPRPPHSAPQHVTTNPPSTTSPRRPDSPHKTKLDSITPTSSDLAG